MLLYVVHIVTTVFERVVSKSRRLQETIRMRCKEQLDIDD
jgi:hypothetical protein